MTHRSAKDFPDPEADLTPDERRHKIARILAQGVLRQRQTAHTSPSRGASRPAKKVSESCRNPLEGAATSSPDPLVG